MDSRTASILSAALRLAQTRLYEFQTIPHLTDPPSDREIDRLCDWLAVQAEVARQRDLRLQARLELITADDQ